MSTGTSPDRRARTTTIDNVRAIAIVFVVLNHVLMGLNTIGLLADGFVDWWAPFRVWGIPALFFAAGLFVAVSLDRDGPLLFATRRTVDLLYPFVIWSLIFGIGQIAAADYTNEGELTLGEVAVGLLPWAARGHMWFLPALLLALLIVAAVYTLGRRAWRWLLLGVALVMFGSAFVLRDLYLGLAYTIWVAIAVVLAAGPLGRWIVAPTRGAIDVGITVMALLLFGASVPVLFGPGREFYLQPVGVLISGSLGILVVVGMGKIIAAFPALARVVSKAGAWSLYIYVTHVPVLAAVRIVMVRFLGVDDLAGLIVAGTVASLLVGCFVGWAAERSPIGLLFHPPRALGRAVARLRAPIRPEVSP